MFICIEDKKETILKAMSNISNLEPAPARTLILMCVSCLSQALKWEYCKSAERPTTCCYKLLNKI